MLRKQVISFHHTATLIDPNIVIYYVIWLPSLVNFLVILGSQHPFSFNFYFMLI